MVAHTPWQKVFFRMGLSQSELARHLNCHRSKISRAVRDNDGLINGRDQVKLLILADAMGVELLPDDFIPDVRAIS